MQQQINLFGKSVEKPKSKPILPSLPSGDGGMTFEEWERKVASEYGRRHIGYPCDIAQDMPIDDRPQHIKMCPDCQELIRKLDEEIYGKSNRPDRQNEVDL